MMMTSATMLAVLLTLSSLPMGATMGAAALAFGTLMFTSSTPAPVPFTAAAPVPVAASMCKNGATRKADDGCNTCSCHDGQWACTEKACARGNR